MSVISLPVDLNNFGFFGPYYSIVKKVNHSILRYPNKLAPATRRRVALRKPLSMYDRSIRKSEELPIITRSSRTDILPVPTAPTFHIEWTRILASSDDWN